MRETMGKRLCRAAATGAVAVLLAGAALAGDSAQALVGRWHFPEEDCVTAYLDITVGAGTLRFRWMEGDVEGETELERIDKAGADGVETTALETAGAEQQDKPGDRFRYTLNGDRLTIELLSGNDQEQVLERCGPSA